MYSMCMHIYIYICIFICVCVCVFGLNRMNLAFGTLFRYRLDGVDTYSNILYVKEEKRKLSALSMCTGYICARTFIYVYIYMFIFVLVCVFIHMFRYRRDGVDT